MVSSQRSRERIRKLLLEHLEKNGLKDDLIGTLLDGDGVDINVESQDDLDLDVLADKVLDRLKERGDLGELAVDKSGSTDENEPDNGPENEPDDDFFDDPDDVDVSYDTESSFGAGELDEDE